MCSYHICGRISDLVCAVAEPFTPAPVARSAGSVRRVFNHYGIPRIIDRVLDSAIQTSGMVLGATCPPICRALTQVGRNLSNLGVREQDRIREERLSSVPSSSLYGDIENGAIYDDRCLGRDLIPQVVVHHTPVDTPEVRCILALLNGVFNPHGVRPNYALDPITGRVSCNYMGMGSMDLEVLMQATDWSAVTLSAADSAAARPVIDGILANGFSVPSPAGAFAHTGPMAPRIAGVAPHLDPLVNNTGFLPYNVACNDLSDAEQKALVLYTTQEGCQLINTFLRGGPNMTALIQANATGPAATGAFINDMFVLCALVSSGLNKVSARTAARVNTVYRCVNLLPGQIAAISQPGHVQDMKGFTSCSSILPSSVFWPSSNAVFIIEGPPPALFKDISPLSCFAKENEMLGQAGLRLCTVSTSVIQDPVNPANTKTAIFMRVIPRTE